MSTYSILKIPRTLVINEGELENLWWIRQGGNVVIVFDGDERVKGLVDHIKRVLGARLVGVHDDVRPPILDVDLILGIGGWEAINKAKILSCTSTANGELGLLGVKQPIEKTYLVLIPLSNLRLAYTPRIIVGKPYNMVLEHPCSIPHEVLLLRNVLRANNNFYCELKVLETLLSRRILGDRLEKPDMLVELYTAKLGIVDAIADALALVGGVDPTTGTIVSALAAIRLGLMKLDTMLEEEPLEKLLVRCCKPVSHEPREDDIVENVLRGLQLYHTVPPPLGKIREAIRETLRILRIHSLVGNDMG